MKRLSAKARHEALYEISCSSNILGFCASNIETLFDDDCIYYSGSYAQKNLNSWEVGFAMTIKCNAYKLLGNENDADEIRNNVDITNCYNLSLITITSKKAIRLFRKAIVNYIKYEVLGWEREEQTVEETTSEEQTVSEPETETATEVTISPYLELPPQEKKSKECETFSREDIDRLWTDDTDEARITLVMIYTGMRIGEILAVRKSDVHLDDNGHNYLIGGEKTEAGRNRTIALHPRIVPFFEAWIAVRDDDDLLVTNAHGNPLSPTLFRERWYAPLLKRVGIPYISPHKARHTFATLVCAAGGNEVALQRQLGHSDFSTTANTYIHPDISALEAIVKLIE